MTAREGFGWLVVAPICAMLMAAGCSSLPPCPDSDPAQFQSKKEIKQTAKKTERERVSQHVIELNNEGRMFDLTRFPKRTLIRYAPAVTNYLEKTILKGFKESRKTNLLLFIHGGMNDRKAGMDHFWKHYEVIERSEFYPVFVVWPTGIWSSYFEHLALVRQGIRAEEPLEKVFSYGTAPFMLLADVGRALTRLPVVLANTAMSDIETVRSATNLNGGESVTQYRDMVGLGYKVHVGDDYSLGSDRFMRGVTFWLTAPLKYLVAIPLIDLFGRPAWGNMHRRAQYAYPDRLDPAELERLAAARGWDRTRAEQEPHEGKTRQQILALRSAAAGLPAFVDALRRRPDVGITLVGHSAGTLILNRVLRDASLEIANVVYTAPACDIEDFSRSALVYIRNHTNSQFYGLTLHPLAEVGEANILDLAPRGSLLVWIDNFLSNPVSEGERTLGSWRNLFRSNAAGDPLIRPLYSNAEGAGLTNRLHFRAFSVGFGDEHHLRAAKHQWNENPVRLTIQQRCNTPLKHTEFNQMPYWERNFWWSEDPPGTVRSRPDPVNRN